MPKVIKFFDKFEDRIRGSLSRRPITYALIGGVGVVLFWRGVWITMDSIPFMNGPVSIIISIVILLGTGLFVSFFIGDRIILSGLKGEKKLAEKTKDEIRSEIDMIIEIKNRLSKIEKNIDEIKKGVNNRKV